MEIILFVFCFQSLIVNMANDAAGIGWIRDILLDNTIFCANVGESESGDL